MKDRLITFGAALAALLLTYIILAPPAEVDDKLSLPTTEDSGPNGLKGLRGWLEQGSVPLLSLRKKYPALPDTTGNLLVLSLPQTREALDSEWQALADWIEKGNTLVLLGHAYRQAPWSGGEDCLCGAEKLLDKLGWIFGEEMSEDDEADTVPIEEEGGEDSGFAAGIENIRQGLEALTPQKTALPRVSSVPLTEGVDTLESEMTPMLTGRQWYLRPAAERIGLRLFAVDGEDGQTMMWQIEAGRGQVFLSLAGDLFSNSRLNRAGNARLFKNLVSRTLSAGGKVIFDDYHFGLSDLYDPEQFFNDSRLHRTVALILLFWFIYVLGRTNRLAPVRQKRPKSSMSDSVEAMAGFFAARLGKKTLARELVRHLLQDIRLRRGLKDEQAVWNWLERHPQIDSARLELMKKAAQKRYSRLHELTDILIDIRSKTLS